MLLRDLIRFFVAKVGNPGRTQIVKFLYLADLEARRYLGRPITDLNYVWHDHGPFDKRILAELDALVATGALTQERIDYPNGQSSVRYDSNLAAMDVSVEKPEFLIANYVAKTYGRMPLRELLEDIVYHTEPMIQAKSEAAYGQMLDMSLVDRRGQLPGVDIERVIQGFGELDRGDFVPLDSVHAGSSR